MPRPVDFQRRSVNAQKTFSVLFRKYPLFRVSLYAVLVGVGIVVLTLAMRSHKKYPVIDSIDPPVGAPGDVMTISGANFGGSRDASFVEIAGIKITESNYRSWSEKSIQLILPSNIRDGLLFVQTAAGKSKPRFFANERGIPVSLPPDTKTFLPTVTAVSEPSATFGSLVTISGTNFGAERGKSLVHFTANRDDITSEENQFLAASEDDYDYEYWSDTEIRVRIPDGAVSGQNQFYVETEKGKSNFFALTVLSNVGKKSYSQRKTYLISVNADIDSIETKGAAAITLRVPRPAKTAAQPLAELSACTPPPSIENYRNTIIHRVELAKATSQKQKLRFEQHFVVSVYAVQSEIAEKQAKPFADKTRVIYTIATAADNLIKSGDDGFVELARSIVANETNPVTQAHLVYDFMIDTYKLNERSRKSDDSVRELAKRKSGDAYDFAILYTTLLRALGIPALPVSGILVDADLKAQNHWWTEFYVEHLGWIPVDVVLGKGISYTPFKKIEDARSFYFGNLDCQHIAFSRGWAEFKPSLANSKIVQRPKSYALQSIWEESSEGIVNYSSLWNDPTIKGIY